MTGHAANDRRLAGRVPAQVRQSIREHAAERQVRLAAGLVRRHRRRQLHKRPDETAKAAAARDDPRRGDYEAFLGRMIERLEHDPETLEQGKRVGDGSSRRRRC